MGADGIMAKLLNDFVCPRDYDLLDGDPERLHGLEIDYQLKFRGLLHRKVSWLRAFKYLVHQLSRSAELIC